MDGRLVFILLIGDVSLRQCPSVRVCSVLFCSISFCAFLFCSVLFCSVLFCSFLFVPLPFSCCDALVCLLAALCVRLLAWLFRFYELFACLRAHSIERSWACALGFLWVAGDALCRCCTCLLRCLLARLKAAVVLCLLVSVIGCQGRARLLDYLLGCVTACLHDLIACICCVIACLLVRLLACLILIVCLCRICLLACLSRNALGAWWIDFCSLSVCVPVCFVARWAAPLCVWLLASCWCGCGWSGVWFVG